MRFVARLLLPIMVWGVAAEGYGQVLDPLDFEFRDRVRAGSVSLPEMLRRMDAKLVAGEIGKELSSADFEFEELYGAAAKKSLDADVEELRKLLLRLPPEFSCFDECFSIYVSREIRRRVAELGRKPTAVTWPENTDALPKELADAPQSLRGAWRSYQAVTAPYREALRPFEQAAGNEASPKLPDLSVDLKRLLKSPPEAEAWKLLARHEWTSFCGTGSEALYFPRNRALLLSFLADGRLPEAAGAVLKQWHSSLMVTEGESFGPVIVALLKSMGLEWEPVLLGSLLPVQSYEMPDRWPVVMRGPANVWRLLAALGSDRAVRSGLDLIRWSKLDPGDACEFCAVALGPDDSVFGGQRLGGEDPLSRTVSLSPELRREVLAVLAEYLAATNRPAFLMKVLKELRAREARELREPLTALLSHPVHAVAAAARESLREVGLATGEEKIAPAAPPLKFRILLNGEPLVGTKVDVVAVGKRDDDERQGKPPTPDWEESVESSQSLVTDDQGRIQYRLDQSLEPGRIAGVRLFHRAKSSPSVDESGIPTLPPPSGLEFLEPVSRSSTNVWLGPFFTARVKAAAGDEQEHEVQVRVSDLEVRLTTADVTIAGDALIDVTLTEVSDRNPHMPPMNGIRVTAKPGESAYFRRLQPGEYAIDVKTADAAWYESGAFVIGETASTREVKLGPGRNVRGTAVYPRGEKRVLNRYARLYRDGVEVKRYGLSEEWKNLGFGKYTVRIWSTTEEEAEYKKYGQAYRTAEEDRIGAREVSFEIDASTPTTLDLGEVVIPREKR